MLFRSMQARFRNRFCRVGMKVHTGAVFERLRRGKKGKERIDSRRGTKSVRGRERHPAGQVFGGESGEVQGGALPCDGSFGGRAMNLHASNANPNSHTFSGGKHFEFVF